MNKKPNVYFFTIGGRVKGFGHVARLIPLYDELKSRQIPVKFIVDGDEAITVLLKDKNYTLSSWEAGLNLVENENIGYNTSTYWVNTIT
jgi:spore coat polysaccharide biosynthesis predicted glycosyltransferase SpsG